MALGDVVAQKAGASSFDALADQLDESGSNDSDSSATVENLTAPRLTVTANGTEYTLTTQTLILYGIALADVLLLYLVWTV